MFYVRADRKMKRFVLKKNTEQQQQKTEGSVSSQ